MTLNRILSHHFYFLEQQDLVKLEHVWVHILSCIGVRIHIQNGDPKSSVNIMLTKTWCKSGVALFIQGMSELMFQFLLMFCIQKIFVLRCWKSNLKSSRPIIWHDHIIQTTYTVLFITDVFIYTTQGQQWLSHSVYTHWPETREFITRTVELWNRRIRLLWYTQYRTHVHCIHM